MSGDTSDPIRGFRVLLFTIGAAIILVGLGSASVWRSRLAAEVNGRLQRIRAQGLPTSGAELNPWYPAVPDQENCALVMTQAFALLQSFSDSRSNQVAAFKLPPRGQQLTEGDRQLLEPYVDMNRPALARAREAFSLPRSRYPVDTSMGPYALLPHLPQLRRLAQISRMDMALALDSGNTTEATASVTCLLKMARTLDEEPLLISQLVRVAILRMAVVSLERRLAVDGLTAAEMTDITEAIPDGGETNWLTRALIGERAIGIPTFRMSSAEIARLTQGDQPFTELAVGRPLPGRQPVLMRLTGFFDRDLNFYLQAMETNITLVQQSPPRSLALTNINDQLGRTALRKKFFLSAMALPSLSRVTVRQAETLAYVASAQAALAVERFRSSQARLPATLDELVPQFLRAVPSDPFDGTPLRYRRLPIGYVIYSVDVDGKDDGGREKPERKKPTDKTTYDITFTVER
jgi:hypothetical protein